jgi:outer membrane protein OmpA-like peptidoglycan-associated protein
MSQEGEKVKRIYARHAPSTTGAPPNRSSGSAPVDLASRVLSLQRTVGNRGVGRLLSSGARTVARRPFEIQLQGNEDNDLGIDAGAYFDPVDVPLADVKVQGVPITRRPAYFDEGTDGLHEVTLDIQAGTHGRISFWADTKLEIKGEKTSKAHVGMFWEVATTKQGGLTLRPTVKEPSTETDERGRTRLGLTHVGFDQDETHREVQVAMGFTGAAISKQETVLEKGRDIKTPSVKVKVRGQEVTIPGIPIWRGDDTTSTEQKTFPVPSLVQNFVIHIRLTDVQPAPKPPAPPKPTPTRPSEWRVRFASDNVTIDASERKWLSDWWRTLQAETRRRIVAGEPLLTIASYADTTGSVTHNDKIADGRKKAVQDALSRQTGVQVNFGPSPSPGEAPYATDEPGQQVPELALRRSVLSVTEPVLQTVNDIEPQRISDEARRRQTEEVQALERQASRARAAPGKTPVKAH